MNQPGLQTVITLRLVSLIAFPMGAALLAIYQRSPLALAGLAALMLVVSLIERRRIAVAQVNGASLVMGFAFRLGLLIGVFVLFNGVLTLFRDTALARTLALPDLLILGATTAAALIGNEVSARIAGRQINAVRSELQAAMRAHQGGPAAEGDGEIIEGEIIDPDPPR